MSIISTSRDYSAPAPRTCKTPTIHIIGLQSKTKPIIDNMEKTDQNQKLPSRVKTGNNLCNNIKIPTGIPANTNTNQTRHLIKNVIIFNNI